MSEENEFTEEDIEEAKVRLLSSPSFPILMLFAAIMKDVLDLLSVGLLGWLFSLFFAGIVWFWLFGKLGFMKKFLLRRLVFTTIIGMIPGLNFLPETTIFVILGHYKEIKVVKTLFKILEAAV